MTIASEITRLQTAKSCLKASIINKGVSVGDSVSLSCYYKCVNEISTGPAKGCIDFLAVGGGGGGGLGYWNRNKGDFSGGGGGGGGGVIEMCGYQVRADCNEIINITVGTGGGVQGNGTCSCFLDIVAYGGGRGDGVFDDGCSGGSGGGGSSRRCGSSGVDGQGHSGGNGCIKYGREGPIGAGGGGGGGGTAGCNADGYYCGGNGGRGYLSSMSGASLRYGGGGGGGVGRDDYDPQTQYPGCGCDGGGDGGKGGYSGTCSGTNATFYGGGGGGGTRCCGGGCGYQGVVIIRYKTDGSCGILNTSTGGCKYTCGLYTIHCYTSNGTFRPAYK